MTAPDQVPKDLIISLRGTGQPIGNSLKLTPEMLDAKCRLTFDVTNPNAKAVLIKWDASSDPDTQIVKSPPVIKAGATEQMKLSLERAIKRDYVAITEGRVKSLSWLPRFSYQVILIEGDTPTQSDFDRLLSL